MDHLSVCLVSFLLAFHYRLLLLLRCSVFFFFNDTATTEIYTLSLHDALPISAEAGLRSPGRAVGRAPYSAPARWCHCSMTAPSPPSRCSRWLLPCRHGQCVPP